MRFFVAFAALAPLLALRGASLGSSHNGSSFCPCIDKDDRWECVEGTLASYVSCPDDFGIGCKTHNISEDCAASLYQSIDVGKQLQCSPSHAGESPWCNTSWCYVNESNCGVDWDYGVLGPYSYATCGNLRQGSDKYFQKTLAAFLQDDPLRVFHAESTLEGGYLGNTGCKKVYKYSQNRHCKGRVAEFWERSLDKLNLPKIDHTVIERDEEEEDIRHYFMDPNITNQFEDYKDRVPLHWSERPTTNFDLCAFATGMGYVDLCSGAFSLTHRRQAMTYVIELYTSPVFMVSKSTCRVFFASEDWRSWKFWFWWVDVFSPGAWGFFVGVVFFFILAMKGLDKCLDCLDNLDKQSGEEPEEQGEPEGPPEEPEKPQEEAQRRMEKFCKCFCCFTHGLADALLGVFEAFVHKSKTSHRRDSKKPSRSRPSHMLRLGLGFFILLSMAMYFAKITADMVLANEVKGEVPSLKDAKKGPNSVSLCTHSVYNESLTLHLNGNAYISANYMDKWEEVLDNLKNETCKAALLDDEAWNTFRSRGELCGYYKEPTVEFYIPTGVVVSKRAYRTLESFRLAPNETPVFWSEAIGHDCRSNSTTCDSTKLGVPWYTFPGPSVVAGVCGLCSLLGIAHHRFVGRDEEYEEEQEKERKKEEMYRNIARLPRIGEEMTIANIERLFDRGFQQNMFQLLQLAEGAGPAPQDAAEPENQDGEACQGQTGAASSSQNPTLLQNLSSHHPHQTPGASLGK